jgi:hypothetical protein
MGMHLHVGIFLIFVWFIKIKNKQANPYNVIRHKPSYKTEGTKASKKTIQWKKDEMTNNGLQDITQKT